MKNLRLKIIFLGGLCEEAGNLESDELISRRGNLSMVLLFRTKRAIHHFVSRKSLFVIRASIVWYWSICEEADNFESIESTIRRGNLSMVLLARSQRATHYFVSRKSLFVIRNSIVCYSFATLRPDYWENWHWTHKSPCARPLNLSISISVDREPGCNKNSETLTRSDPSRSLWMTLLEIKC